MAKSRKGKNTGIFALMLLGLGGGGLLAAYVLSNPNAGRVPQDLRKPDEPQVAQQQKPIQKPSHVVTPIVKDDGVEYSKKNVTVPPGQNPKVYLVNEALKETKVVPQGARLLGIDMKDGVAYLDFNPAFQYGYSSTEETVVINAVLQTLRQFPDVKKVQFQIEGQPMETLGGHFELSEPLDVNVQPG